MKTAWKQRLLQQCTKPKVFFWMALVGIFILTAFYRFYQPLTHPALLQFDIFDWARKSKEYLQEGHLVTQSFLWIFPVWNAMVSRVSGFDLFYVYLYSGAALTTLNIVFFLAIGRMLWPQNLFLQLAPSIYYAFNYQLLARSVNYLPETMSFTFGLALVYLYLLLLMKGKWWLVIPILIVTYLYYHLHQSGLNFILFTSAVLAAYVLFVLPLARRWRLFILLGGLGLSAVIVAVTDPLRQQFLFFLHGNANDAAFQGTAIPIKQLLIDYPMAFVVPLIIGVTAIIFRWFRRRSVSDNLSWATIFLIAGFYYGFLYILPNLSLYNLVPWRFYTWFSLFAMFIVVRGLEVILQAIQGNRLVTGLVVGFVILNIFSAALISDNMYTADATTLQEMARMPIPSGSTVVTTNANYLQAKYALLEQQVIVQQGGAELFKAKNSHDAARVLEGYRSDTDVYILISKYQLRQRPSSIDYWRNSAIYDMKLELFGSEYFQLIAETSEVLLLKLSR